MGVAPRWAEPQPTRPPRRATAKEAAASDREGSAYLRPLLHFVHIANGVVVDFDIF